MDSGIARAADAGALTGTGLRVGTPAFMAPEQALGRPVGPATDVFALGALAACVAGGAPPFGAGPESAALYRVVHEGADLGAVPAGLRPLLWHCLAKDPADRPGAAEVIEAVRSHPAVGGELRFTEDRLPHQVAAELRRHADAGLPVPPATAPYAALTLTAPRAAVPAEAPRPPGAREPRPRRRRRAPASGRGRGRTAAVAAAALLLGAAGAFALLGPYFFEGGDEDPADPAEVVAGAPASSPAATPASSPAATPTPAPSTPPAAPGCTAVHTGTELTSPDQSYEFDVEEGRVVPQETASWYVGRSTTEFYVPESSDAYVMPSGRRGLADCFKGIESRPVTALPFTTPCAGRAFCVRARDGRDVGIVSVLTAVPGEGPVKVSVDDYRRTG
ncbi:hypothetical protein [Streptomyces sp. NPDC000656]|uniref:protein kinase domain-containing protein n=1 Tax=unclassified Streptomyces TaxID=2593676 RepID=UPI0036971940